MIVSIMKNILTIIILFLQCCSGTTQETILERVDNTRFEKLLQNKNTQLIDVRTLDEYKQGHIESSQLIDFSKNTFSDEMSAFDKEKPILIYCAGGGRSGRASNILKDLGFREIYDLKAGINGWIGDSKKIVR